MVEPTNTWAEWSMYVIMTLEDTNKVLKTLEHENHRLSKDIAVLKVKIDRTYKIMGVSAGALPVLVILSYFLINYVRG